MLAAHKNHRGHPRFGGAQKIIHSHTHKEENMEKNSPGNTKMHSRISKDESRVAKGETRTDMVLGAVSLAKLAFAAADADLAAMVFGGRGGGCRSRLCLICSSLPKHNQSCNGACHEIRLHVLVS
jgi:hypothetical protein